MEMENKDQIESEMALLETIEIKTETKKDLHPFLMPGAILIAGIFIAGAVVYSNMAGSRSESRPLQGTGSGNARAPVSGNIEDDDPVLGNPKAPITLVEFSDFQCPFCQKFFLEAEPKIIEKYVKTGKAKLVYRDFPLVNLHPMAEKTAEAGECAHEQDKFWQYHDLVFRNQADLSDANLQRWAPEAGLDAEKFNQCLSTAKYAKEVQKDEADGEALGVNATPTVFVGGHLVAGALPFEDYSDGLGGKKPGFDSLIQQALQEKK